MTNILWIIAGTIIGAGFSVYILKGKKLFDFDKRKKSADEVVEKSVEEATKILEDAKAYVQKRKENLEQEMNKKEERLNKVDEALRSKEGFIQRRVNRSKEVELSLASLNEEVQSKTDSIKRMDREVVEKLAAKTGQKTVDLKEEMLTKYGHELEEENQERLVKIEEILKEEAPKKAAKVVVQAIQRLCSPTSVESRAVTIKVPKDHIKGKIVGKDGQNILELEKLIDVDIVFNDMPNVISVSAFQLVERRVAQKAIKKLINNRGDINPGVVRKTVEAARKDTDDELYEIGKKALKRMEIKNDNKEFARIVGRLEYRTSYGQNIMKHSMEIGWVAAILGSELGLDIKTCRVAGFLHDLGKAIDQDPNIDKPHDYLTKDLMEEYGFSWEEVHAAWTHHDAIPQETAEALVVKAADAISASRPGARQESFEKYVARIKALQAAAESFDGVRRAYAISAGREVRVQVEPDEISDDGLRGLAQSLAGKIENELTYPGQIKVNVIRRTKHTEIAK